MPIYIRTSNFQFWLPDSLISIATAAMSHVAGLEQTPPGPPTLLQIVVIGFRFDLSWRAANDTTFKAQVDNDMDLMFGNPAGSAKGALTAGLVTEQTKDMQINGTNSINYEFNNCQTGRKFDSLRVIKALNS